RKRQRRRPAQKAPNFDVVEFNPEERMYASFLRRAMGITTRLCLVGAMAGSAAHAMVSGSFAFDGNGTNVTVSLASLLFAGGNDSHVTSSVLTYGSGTLLAA